MRTKEPAMIGAALAAVVSAVVLLVFGHELSKEEEAALIGAATLVAGLFVRSQVTPVGGA